MSTSRQTFSQVKDILKKLDRSIDDARAKRLGDAPNGSRSVEESAPNGHSQSAKPLDHADATSAFQRRVG